MNSRIIKKALLSLFLIIGLTHPVSACMYKVESLDSLVVKRPHIAIIEVIPSESQNQTESKSKVATKFRINKVLKGVPPQDIILPLYLQKSPVFYKEIGTQYLMFYNTSKEITEVFNLSFPLEGAAVVSSVFEVLQTKDEIMKLVDRRLIQTGTMKEIYHNIPPEKPAWKALCQDVETGCNCSLVIPDDWNSTQSK